jgi:hypothetical protein
MIGHHLVKASQRLLSAAIEDPLLDDVEVPILLVVPEFVTDRRGDHSSREQEGEDNSDSVPHWSASLPRRLLGAGRMYHVCAELKRRLFGNDDHS